MGGDPSTHLEETCVGRLITLNTREELCWDLSGSEASCLKIGVFELSKGLSVELRLKLLENMSKFCKHDKTR